VSEAEAAEIANRTGGNPFFIVETTGMVLRARQDGAASSGRALPPTVQAVVAARLDSLRHRLRDLARRASVFIFSFDGEELATVSDAELEDLRGLEEAEILVRDDAGRVPRWRFRHETVREVAYASLPKRERRLLHERIADALMESGHRSYAADHLERAALASLDLDPGDRRLPDLAVDALILAGDRARRRMESRSALDYYHRALAMAGPEGSWAVREARALAGTGEAHYWLGEYPAASQALARAVDARPGPAVSGRHRDQRRRGPRRGGAVAGRLAGRRRRAGRRLGDVEVAAVRRLGPVDPGGVRGGG
jgi:predicted ATPase